MVTFGHALMFFADEFVAHLLRLRTKHETLFVEEEYVRQPRTLGQDKVKFLFFFLGVSVERGKEVPRLFGHRVSLLVDFLFGNCEYLLKLPMEDGLDPFVALEGSQLAEIDVYERCRRQDNRETQ